MVVGDASAAIAALGCRHHRLAGVSVTEALDVMAWTAASGGARGRRRGSAAGRYGALWALLNVVGIADPDLSIRDHDFHELAGSLADFRFFVFNDGSDPTGWNLNLAIEDTADGSAFAVTATDARLE